MSEKNRPGSYLMMQMMKDTYHHVGKNSPNGGQASCFGTPTGQHLLSEIQRLQAANAKLNSKLAFAANRVPGLHRMLGMESTDGSSHIGGIGLLSKREDSATMAAGRAPRRSTDVSGTGTELILDDLLLSHEEVQEAAMRCCWLARYWTLAEQLGICEDIAHEKAAYWRALALPLSAYFEIAQSAALPHVAAKPAAPSKEVSLHTRVAEASIKSSAAGSMVTHAPADQSSAEPQAFASGGATIADVVELERGLRQLAELGVVQEVLASLMHQRQAAISAQLQAGVDGHDPDEFPSLPSRLPSPSTVSTTAMAGSMQQGTGSQAEAGVAQAQGVDEDPRTSNSSSNEICASEAQEVAFQRAWLAYIWSRAASSGVEPHICRDRAEHWGHLLLWGNKALPPSSTASTQQGGISGAPKDSPFAAAALPSQVASGGSPALVHAKELVDVRAGQQELARLGVDLQIWALRAHSLRNFV